MTVRRMSAHPVTFLAFSPAIVNEQCSNYASFQAAMSSPKAEVTSSNLVGRASGAMA
jgi:hypothetical protein